MTTLFLKYRPQVFSDVVGQTAVIKTLQNALKAERPAHAYLFSGSRGTGKTSTARIFAKGLNCPNLKDGSPCGTCNICTGTADGSLVDVIEIDAASNRGIDEIRDLREKILFAPNIAKRKVYIIDEVHMLTKEAFNALLKTLEEPPEHAYFVLATTELHKVPETIVSRCQTFIFQRFTLDQLADHLGQICQKESYSPTPEALQLIARRAEGGLRDAISLCEQIASETDGQITDDAVRTSLGLSGEDTLEAFWVAVQSKDAPAALTIIEDLAHKGADFRTFGHDVLGYLRAHLHENLENPSHARTIIRAIEEVQTALFRLKTAPIVELPFEIAVMNLCLGDAPTQPVVKAVKTVPAATPQPQSTQEKPQLTPTPKPVKKAEPAPETVESKPEPKPEPPVEVTIDAKPAPEESIPQPNDGFVFDGEEPPAPVVKATPQAVPAAPKPQQETPVSQREESIPAEESFSEDTIKQAMRAIAQKSGITPFARKSFLAASPSIADPKRVIFMVSSEFHLGNLNKAAVRMPIQDAMNTILKQNCSIEFQTNENLASSDDLKSMF